ncbi:tRNA (N(6)-L-threonylcarbamoyladenosine(37)-C(2))-methylthiotransferase MtaB [Desulfopila sp. IMCC35008]|uniref:tRNA (N(6)-L-threonylcarbamoyladenosine(37)-C(2))- methylthiotransferase MtaB n=1 Tax=Desulfopila sp. IMCC35008 TaxID=2653858 RepID=UPI0013D14835|nr:tRNA (N(6)-L-threonylcarbamoyladenosine(37)-C(2))-methylthiotransferase MtaB [Desulfopila sp. IMCC35008]
MKKVFITTLGCKVNQFESAAFATGFLADEFQLVPQIEEADIAVINSCAVTARAGAQSRQLIRQATRNNPQCRIIITGCYAEIASDEIAAFEDLANRDYSIIGNSKKDKLVETATSLESEPTQNILGSIMEADTICDLPVNSFQDRTRAYLRVQDGCESYCTYCIVPYTRGPNRSLPLAKIREQTDCFIQGGFKEIVLTGIHLGYYGKDLHERHDIIDLVDTLTKEYQSTRFRISSLEPTEITDALLELIEDRDNLMPHLHIPLQSGNDEILSQMNRHYTTKEFSETVHRCVAKVPEIAIGIDILAGFPGESEAHFLSTLDFVSSLPCTYLHVFPYSDRPGTVASTLPNKIKKHIKAERVNRLRKIGTAKRESFYKRQIGRVVPVLVEGKRDAANRLKGFSDNYIAVRFEGDDSLKNKVVNVRLVHSDGSWVAGEVI